MLRLSVTIFKCPLCRTGYELIMTHISFQQRSYANCRICRKTMDSWHSSRSLLYPPGTTNQQATPRLARADGARPSSSVGAIRGQRLMCCGVSIQRRLQIERIHGHHFDRSRAMRLHRHENHRRNPSVNRKRQLLDQFLVRKYLVLAGRQGSINAFQQKWMNEVDCFSLCACCHSDCDPKARPRPSSPSKLSAA